MRTIFAGIKTLTKAIVQVIKNIIVKIKNGLIKIFSPIFHFFKLIFKGIFFVFKMIVVYLFIKPLLFLYHHIVLPVLKGIRWVAIGVHKVMIKPIFHFLSLIFQKIKNVILLIASIIKRFFLCIFRFIYYKIVKPIYLFLSFIIKSIGRFFKFILLKILFIIKWITLQIGKFFSMIFQFIYNKILKPIYLFFKYIFNKIGRFLSIFFRFIYYKILKPIFHFIYLIFKTIGKGIRWIVLKIGAFFQFIYTKILKPIFHFLGFIIKKIGSFIYHYIIRPIYLFFRYILKKIYQFLIWIYNGLVKIGKVFWHILKFSGQTIFAGFIVIISIIISFFYTFLIYPFRILFIENRTLICNQEKPFGKRLWANAYYICHQIKDKNNQQRIQFQEKKSDFTIFIRIKNIVAFVPSILYSIMLYPINFIIILLSAIFKR